MSFAKIENGMNNSWISCITQDAKGFIWVGTQDGLHRYDGYSFEILRNSPRETESLMANWVRTIVADPDNSLWIGTHGGGLTKFSPHKMSFANFALEEPDVSSGNIVFKAISVNDKYLLSATEEGFQVYNFFTGSRRNLGYGTFKSNIAASEDFLWLTDNQHLYRQSLGSETKILVHTFDSTIQLLEYIPSVGLVVGLKDNLILYKENKIDRQIAIDETVVSIAADTKGGYFLASGTSLFKLNTTRFELTKVSTDIDTTNRQIKTVFADSQGNLWVGTDKGLYKERKQEKAFLQNPIELHARRIIKHKGSIYLGGAKGLFKVEDNSVLHIIQDRGITALFDEGESIMASSAMEEIYKVVDDSPNVTIPISTMFDKKLVVYGLAKDRKGRLWVGSWMGLHLLDEQGKLLKFIPLNTGSKNGEAKIIDILIDSRDRLWVITAGYGLYSIKDISAIDKNTVSPEITGFRNSKKALNSISSDIILSTVEDEKGQMWFGTEFGVVRYLEDSNGFAKLEYQGKVFDKKVMDLQIDSDQNLWITTISDGIYVFNEVTKTMRHFTTNDGLISNAFLFGSGFYDQVEDLMYFGTNEGIQKIDLSQTFSVKSNPRPLISKIQINNAEDKSHIAPLTAPFIKELYLASNQNDFSVRFSALDFSSPENIRYLYALDDDEWRTTDLQTAYFTNVPYGNHTLKVKAVPYGMTSNQESTTLRIYIKPPWYLSTIAKILYVLLLCSVVFGLHVYAKWRWNMKLNLKISQENARRLKKLHDMKSRLYTEIAHEFKTPLTLISGPIDSSLLEGNLSEFDRSNFSLVQRNANRLSCLVDQLLELAKLEDGKLNMKISEGNLGLLLQTISSSFQFSAQTKNLRYEAEITGIGLAWYDEDVIEKIITNLLSNAFKYTSPNGLCCFSAWKKADRVYFSVRNTARDASELPLEKLFDRFYQHNDYSEGMGIGLSLVRELVKVYGGKIALRREQDDILEFRIEMPVNKSAFKQEWIVETSELNTEKGRVSRIYTENEGHLNGLNAELPILLIIEDHDEIRSFIKSALEKEYRILEAQNGKTGMELATSRIPDIILSDIRMPLLNGIDLCDVLKKDQRTSHIPIILLTASMGEEFELKGLTSGADDYITKPFKIKVLRQRIANLVTVRKKLRDRYRKEFVLKPKDIAITPGDEAFLNRVQQILDEYLTDPEFNAESFSQKAGMSRMQLHRKLLAYTGLSTSAFIRSQRLNQAINLLKSSDLTISEVAYTVGFNTPRYFMKCFKETFKKTPSEYLQSIVYQ
ncbi:hybrid sensor histidine kinase/response regulator transcription factor [Poritiphilus flavus]|uniref:histidine kinase n=1 Tax=Poritiphilus flavus TaxID=2697053 RepID=A0A6L9EAZ0_9FLAO|nr:two-component regulator propeller domain-containing protein [Poritiphilus flavus]NAS11870.1 response regulator [Poritiphilus flavus]